MSELLTPDRARVLAATAIKNGSLERQPCEVCGKEPADAHHEDYQKPYDVRWVCRLHHRWVHCYGRSVDRQIDERCVRAFGDAWEAA